MKRDFMTNPVPLLMPPSKKTWVVLRVWLHHLRADEAGHEIKWLAAGQNTNWGGLYYTSSHDYHTITPSRVPFLTVKNASIFLLFPIGIFLHPAFWLLEKINSFALSTAASTIYNPIKRIAYFSFYGITQLHMNSFQSWLEFGWVKSLQLRWSFSKLNVTIIFPIDELTWVTTQEWLSICYHFK